MIIIEVFDNDGKTLCILLTSSSRKHTQCDKTGSSVRRGKEVL